MGFVRGMVYNLRGVGFGIRTPRLLVLGLIRFAVVVLMTLAAAGMVLVYHGQIMGAIWMRPDSLWLVWLWHLASWMIGFVLFALAGILSYLLAQVLFAVVIMDTMSRITERMVTGDTAGADAQASFVKQLAFLVVQELPRAVLPMVLLTVLTVLGWLTPAAPVVTVLSSGAAAVFLAWDNTDLVPARRMRPFGERFAFLLKTLPFHLGFGLLFLVPVLNVLCLSFAPVGATLFFLERQPAGPNGSGVREQLS